MKPKSLFTRERRLPVKREGGEKSEDINQEAQPTADCFDFEDEDPEIQSGEEKDVTKLTDESSKTPQNTSLSDDKKDEKIGCGCFGTSKLTENRSKTQETGSLSGDMKDVTKVTDESSKTPQNTSLSVDKKDGKIGCGCFGTSKLTEKRSKTQETASCLSDEQIVDLENGLLQLLRKARVPTGYERSGFSITAHSLIVASAAILGIFCQIGQLIYQKKLGAAKDTQEDSYNKSVLIFGYTAYTYIGSALGLSMIPASTLERFMGLGFFVDEVISIPSGFAALTTMNSTLSVDFARGVGILFGVVLLCRYIIYMRW